MRILKAVFLLLLFFLMLPTRTLGAEEKIGVGENSETTEEFYQDNSLSKDQTRAAYSVGISLIVSGVMLLEPRILEGLAMTVRGSYRSMAKTELFRLISRLL